MGRTETLHPRQGEIDRILIENEGKGSYETVLRLLAEAGIDSTELSHPPGSHLPDRPRINKLRDRAKKRRDSSSPPALIEASRDAMKWGQERRAAELALASAQQRYEHASRQLEEAQARLLAASEHLGSEN